MATPNSCNGLPLPVRRLQSPTGHKGTIGQLQVAGEGGFIHCNEPQCAFMYFGPVDWPLVLPKLLVAFHPGQFQSERGSNSCLGVGPRLHQIKPDYICLEPLKLALNLKLSPGDLAREEKLASIDFTDHSSLLSWHLLALGDLRRSTKVS